MGRRGHGKSFDLARLVPARTPVQLGGPSKKSSSRWHQLAYCGHPLTRAGGLILQQAFRPGYVSSQPIFYVSSELIFDQYTGWRRAQLSAFKARGRRSAPKAGWSPWKWKKKIRFYVWRR